MRVCVALAVAWTHFHAEDALACRFVAINHNQKGLQLPITITGGPLSRSFRSLTSFLRSLRSPHSPRTQALVVVEGPNDIEFLRRISTILHRDDRSLPDLAAMERELALVFVPSGGVDHSPLGPSMCYRNSVSHRGQTGVCTEHSRPHEGQNRVLSSSWRSRSPSMRFDCHR